MKLCFFSRHPVQWCISDALVPYEAACRFMDAQVERIAQRVETGADEAAELVWLLQHTPLYTGGTSAKAADLLTPDRFPIHTTSRGGQYTYHGPGQRIAYVMLDLRSRRRDVRKFVWTLEEWIIRTLAAFDVPAQRCEGLVGVWVRPLPSSSCDCGGMAKIAAVGVRLRRWVSLHGVSLNVNPDLSHYDGIVPCGVRQYGVTSLAALGRKVSLQEVDQVLRREFTGLFGATRLALALPGSAVPVIP